MCIRAEAPAGSSDSLEPEKLSLVRNIARMLLVSCSKCMPEFSGSDSGCVGQRCTRAEPHT